jgi:hypothetical protein
LFSSVRLHTRETHPKTKKDVALLGDYKKRGGSNAAVTNFGSLYSISAMSLTPSLVNDNCHAGSYVPLVCTVFYDPYLFHYVSSGWDLSELLSQRVHTSTSTFAQLTLPMLPTRTDEYGVRYVVRASELRRAALRALLLHNYDDVEVMEGGEITPMTGSASDGGCGTADDSLEAAVERWLRFAHLTVHGAKQGAAPKAEDHHHSVTPHPSVLIVDDEPAEEQDVESMLPSALSALRKEQHRNHRHQREKDNSMVHGQFPLAFPTPSSAVVSLVLTFVKDAHTWRQLRRDARPSSAPAHDMAGGDSGNTEQRRASVPAHPTLFVSDDDVLFTKWLQSKRDLRRQWRRQWEQRSGAQKTEGNASKLAQGGVPCPSIPLSALTTKVNSNIITNSDSSRSSSESSDDEGGAQRCNESASTGCDGGCGPACAAIDAKARRAAVLAAIERRRQR